MIMQKGTSSYTLFAYTLCNHKRPFKQFFMNATVFGWFKNYSLSVPPTNPGLKTLNTSPQIGSIVFSSEVHILLFLCGGQTFFYGEGQKNKICGKGAKTILRGGRLRTKNYCTTNKKVHDIFSPYITNVFFDNNLAILIFIVAKFM